MTTRLNLRKLQDVTSCGGGGYLGELCPPLATG